MLDKINYSNQLQELETKLLDVEFRKSSSLVGKLLTDDFIEFRSSGCIYNKLEVMAGLQSEVAIKRKLRNFNIRILADNIVLVTYISASYNDAGVEESASLRSSIWNFIDNSWKMIFHQGTCIKDPIILEEYDNNWSNKALAEINVIRDKCRFDWIVDIQHIGSTAIVGIKSKPIIDIMIGVKNISEAQQLIPIIESIGYVFWQENPKKDRLFFAKGMPPFGKQRTHHVHVCEFNCDEWRDRQAFRDYLNTYESDRIAYEVLKLKLANEFYNDRESYTTAKSAFIKNIMQKIHHP